MLIFQQQYQRSWTLLRNRGQLSADSVEKVYFEFRDRKIRARD
jgi:hypothetical protein